jgi:hypothetical protein
MPSGCYPRKMVFMRGLRSQECNKQRLSQIYRMAGSAQFSNNFTLARYVSITLTNVPLDHLKFCFSVSHAWILTTHCASAKEPPFQ